MSATSDKALCDALVTWLDGYTPEARSAEENEGTLALIIAGLRETGRTVRSASEAERCWFCGELIEGRDRRVVNEFGKAAHAACDEQSQVPA